MKNSVLIFLCIISGTVTLMITMTMYGRVHRSMELQSNLSSVVEETVENLMINSNYSINDRNEFLADLTESLSYTIDAQSDIEVDVWQCDTDRGILAVNVSAIYKHPNGNDGAVSCERMVIFNKREATVEPVQYKVSFYVGSTCYKTYEVSENSVISSPAIPKEGGKVFYGWMNADGTAADITQSVTQNMCYYADLR